MDKNPIVENLQRPFDWSGFYIGCNVGGIFSQYEFEGRGGDTDGHLFSDVDIGQQLAGGLDGIAVVRFLDTPDNDRPDRENYISAIIGGGQIGYQHQFGHWVFGIEGDFDRTSIRDSAKFRDNAFTTLINTFPDGIDSPNGDFNTRVTGDTDFFGKREAHTNWIGSVRGKFGYATGPLLFYATAGIAFAGVDMWAHDVANTLFDILEVEDDVAPRAFHPNPPDFPKGLTLHQTAHVANTDIEKDDDVMVGYTAGAGLEIAFNDAVSLALEYRHNDFGDETFNFNHHNNTAGHGGPIFPGSTNLNFDSDQLTVRMNVLLNHFFGNGGGYASVAPSKNNIAVKSPFGEQEITQVGYTRRKTRTNGRPKTRKSPRWKNRSIGPASTSARTPVASGPITISTTSMLKLMRARYSTRTY